MRFKKSPIVKTLKNIIGLCALPVVIIFVCAFLSFLSKILWFSYPSFLFITGFLFSSLLFFVDKKSLSYVFAHEAMHAIASLLFVGKLISIFVSQKNGSVRTTKENFIISLVPYCVPFYAMLLLLVYYFLSIVVKTEATIAIYVFLLGATMAHHCVFTVHYLKIGQSDVKDHGTLFSLVLIVLSNICLTVLLLSVFLKGASFDLFWRNTCGMVAIFR